MTPQSVVLEQVHFFATHGSQRSEKCIAKHDHNTPARSNHLAFLYVCDEFAEHVEVEFLLKRLYTLALD